MTKNTSKRKERSLNVKSSNIKTDNKDNNINIKTDNNINIKTDNKITEQYSDSNDDWVSDEEMEALNECAGKVEDEPLNSIYWYRLCLAMVDANASATTINNKLMTILEVHVKTVELDTDDGDAWVNLGATMNNTDHVNLLNKTMTQQDVRIKAVELVPYCSSSWNNLASSLQSDKTCMIQGKTYNRVQVILESLRLAKCDDSDTTNTELSGIYDTMGLVALDCPSDDKANNIFSEYTAQCFFIKALELDILSIWPWFNLAYYCLRHEDSQDINQLDTVEIQGKSYNEMQCYRKVFCDSDTSEAFFAELEPFNSKAAEYILHRGIYTKTK